MHEEQKEIKGLEHQTNYVNNMLLSLSSQQSKLQMACESLSSWLSSIRQGSEKLTPTSRLGTGSSVFVKETMLFEPEES